MNRKPGPKRQYTPKQLQWLSSHVFGTPYAALTKMFNRRFRVQKDKEQIRNACHYYGFPNTGKTALDRPPIGSCHTETTGYVRVKISSGIWKYKHRVLWESVNGHVPKGYIVMFADGNKTNININNLILVRRREMSYMNRFGMFSSNPDVTKINLIIVRHRLLISDKVNKLAGNNFHYSIENKFRRMKAK